MRISTLQTEAAAYNKKQDNVRTLTGVSPLVTGGAYSGSPGSAKFWTNCPIPAKIFSPSGFIFLTPCNCIDTRKIKIKHNPWGFTETSTICCDEPKNQGLQQEKTQVSSQVTLIRRTFSLLRRRLKFQWRPRLKELQKICSQTSWMTLPNLKNAKNQNTWI